MFCQYCNKAAKSNISKQQHEIRCKSNPAGSKVKPSYGMLGKKGKNQFSKARQNGTEIPVVTAETKAKSLATKMSNGTLAHSQETRDKLSASMKRAVENNPESYSSSNRGRTKQIIVDGIKLQGQWEVDFYQWAISAGLNPNRPTTAFKYEWNGSRSYFPDFYIESIGYIEVKGYETDKDRAKWAQFPELLFVVKAQAIKNIRNNIFTVDQLKDLCYNKLS